MTIALELSPEQQQMVLDADMQAANAIRNAAEDGVFSASNQFVYFAAFDGTNNDADTLPETTNVRQLWTQFNVGGNFDGSYWSGPGTSGLLDASSWYPPLVTARVISTAEAAYQDFAIKAGAWLREHPEGTVTTALTAFSRGCASAAIFSQMVYERGITIDGNVVVPPGQIGVSAAVIFDPVMTGVDVNLAFAPNVKNVVDVIALNEYRSLFMGADYWNNPVITHVGMYGNHCDIGGSYGSNEDGIASISLEAATGFFSDCGLPINDVPESRQFNYDDPYKELKVHDESWAWDPAMMDYRQVWATYNYTLTGFSTKERWFAGAYPIATTEVSDDGLITQSFLLYNGARIRIAQPQEGMARVEEESKFSDGSRQQVIRHYQGITGDLERAFAVDNIVVLSDANNSSKAVDARFYVEDETVTFGVGNPGGAGSTILKVTGAGAFKMNTTLGSGQDMIDLSEMSWGGRVNLAGGDSPYDPGVFTVDVDAANTIVNVKGGSGDDTLIGNGYLCTREAKRSHKQAEYKFSVAAEALHFSRLRFIAEEGYTNSPQKVSAKCKHFEEHKLILEPPRKSRRLRHLRKWSHEEEINKIFAGGHGARSAPGLREQGAIRIAVGGD